MQALHKHKEQEIPRAWLFFQHCDVCSSVSLLVDCSEKGSSFEFLWWSSFSLSVSLSSFRRTTTGCRDAESITTIDKCSSKSFATRTAAGFVFRFPTLVRWLVTRASRTHVFVHTECNTYWNPLSVYRLLRHIVSATLSYRCGRLKRYSLSSDIRSADVSDAPTRILKASQ